MHLITIGNLKALREFGSEGMTPTKLRYEACGMIPTNVKDMRQGGAESEQQINSCCH